MPEWDFDIKVSIFLLYLQSATGATSLSQTSFPPGISSEVNFEALGISNPPSWSVMLADDAGGTQLVQVPKAPVVEGLPLPSDLQVMDYSGCNPSLLIEV